MSLADQITVTYIAVGLVVGLLSWLATENRSSGVLILSLVCALAGAFGVEVFVANVFGIYATFGSLDSLIGTSIIKSAIGAIITVLLMRLVLHFFRLARGGESARG